MGNIYFTVATTKRKRINRSPYEFMPDPIPAGTKVLEVNSIRYRENIPKDDAIRLLRELLAELEDEKPLLERYYPN